jgi:alpha-glucosidase
VVHALGKDPAAPDASPDRERIPWSAQNDHPSTHDILRRIRSLLDARPQQPVAVGEVFLLDTEKVASYVGPDQLHLAFDFTPMFSRFRAESFRARIEAAERLVAARGGWPTWVLSSHDRTRHRSRYGSEAAARAAAVLLLTLRGTPFLYAGEELGLEDADVPPDQAVDPGGRDGCRAPIPWEPGPGHGWALAGGEPWLPWPPDPERRNAQRLREDEGSILHLYRGLLALRRQRPALRRGSLELLDTPPGVLGYRRASGEDAATVLVNFAEQQIDVAPVRGRRVLASSAGDGARCAPGAPTAGLLGPLEAVVLDGA